MNLIKSIFWNTEEGRLRALWRLVGQSVIFIFMMAVLMTIISFLGLGIMASQGGISPEQLSDPQGVEQVFRDTPAILVMGTLAILAAMALSVWIAGRILDRRELTEFGLHFNRDWWLDLGFGLVLGGLLMAVIFLVELAAGWVSVTGTFVSTGPVESFFPAILIPLVFFIAVGIYEELFSRGYQLINLAEGLNFGFIGRRGAVIVAALLSSAVFGYLHILNPNADFLSTFNIFVAGTVIFALGFILTGELAIPIGIHIAWNFFQGNVFGFPVSGTSVRAATFISIEQLGPELWTGGAFGPEGGLLGLAVMLLGGLVILLWVNSRRGSIRIKDELAEAPKNIGKKSNIELEEDN